jgi:hypothetical protein
MVPPRTVSLGVFPQPYTLGKEVKHCSLQPDAHLEKDFSNLSVRRKAWPSQVEQWEAEQKHLCHWHMSLEAMGQGYDELALRDIRHRPPDLCSLAEALQSSSPQRHVHAPSANHERRRPLLRFTHISYTKIQECTSATWRASTLCKRL